MDPLRCTEPSLVKGVAIRCCDEITDIYKFKTIPVKAACRLIFRQ